MPSILYLEPVGGIAGDMFLAAALDLGVPRDALERALASLGLSGFRLEVNDRADVQGIRGTHVDVVVEGPQPHARALSDIVQIVKASGLSPRVRDAALSLFERIGRAEATAHGVPIERIHFHEIGAVNSIVNVCGAAVVLELLGWPRVVAQPPELGQGWTTTAHGRLPVPPPAVLEILRGVPVKPGGPVGEAVTPTGAAILAGLCEVGAPPPFVPQKVGYGVGTKRWSDRPNVLRMTLGELSQPLVAGEAGQLTVRAGVVQIEANLDDCSGQLVARAIEAALEAGALDAWATPCTMKKGRPGIVLGALAPSDRRDAVARAFFTETTTLGVRIQPVDRIELDREFATVATAYGDVRVKLGQLAGELLSAHPEYDDCVSRAKERGTSVKEVAAAAFVAWRALGGK